MMSACRRHNCCRIALLGIRHFPLAAQAAGYIHEGPVIDVTKCQDATPRRAPDASWLDASPPLPPLRAL